MAGAGLDANRMAVNAIKKMGGKVTPLRVRLFKSLCEAVVEEFQQNLLVQSTGADPQGGVVSSTSTVVR